MARFLTIAIALTLPALSGAAWAIPEDPYDDYQAGDFGRIRHEEHGVSVVRGTESSPGPTAEASVNAPVFPGDSIRTDLDQRTEIQLAGGTLVRVDHGTHLTFQSLPDPYAEYVDNAVLKLASGVIQISATLDGKEEFRIDTPDASIYLLGDFRIEVDDRGETRVFSRRGVAEVVGDGGSVLLRGGMRTTVWAGAIPDDPQPFNSFVTDPFDGWVEARAESYRTEETYAYTAEAVEAYDEIPTEVRPYYRELSAHGRWVYVPTYGYCWYPFDTPKDWRPYYNGYWDYGPGGYFWVSHEPWGWAPYHYGRWNWVSGYGWCWIPGRVFGGAWVYAAGDADRGRAAARLGDIPGAGLRRSLGFVVLGFGLRGLGAARLLEPPGLHPDGLLRPLRSAQLDLRYLQALRRRARWTRGRTPRIPRSLRRSRRGRRHP